MSGGTRPRIVHLALKVDDLERTAAFYRDVLGFTDVATARVRDHTSAHLTDGRIDFALIRYDADSTSAESRAAGEGPCIHHFAVEVDDLERAKARIVAYGCEIVSDQGVVPIKFRAPGGTLAELVPRGRYEVTGAGERNDDGDDGAATTPR
jgi:lactoylglutathione lyase